MDQNLAYLHEVLSNYTEDNEAAQDIDRKISNLNFSSEEEFVKELNQEQIQLLSQILSKEMHHANESGDHERGFQLNEVNELLF
ncbi:sigma-G-dependent sporulation-specific acid-soluble spore protein CsgA [Aquibacillus saliphilus]|uniref:sigma-G-dependent sporulation-specific acid-soluble spore protein CsgA n=1 Tax=Aquibacillus saliphilus TaxID=1909422 RepID=UPI001CF076F2|nr:sigma-G-dependent sporulation-specific acid-soluble spore protein CsgA [Aquibacillus saliphilus]